MNPADLTFQADIAHWTWTIAWFLWFVGIAGMGSVAYYFVRKAPVAYTVLGALIIGLALVFSHLARWWNMPMVMWTMIINGHFNFGSWMFIGICVLSVHLVLGILLAASHMDFIFDRLKFLKPVQSLLIALRESNLFVALFGFVGFFGVIYSGFLLTQAVGIPLWGTSLIPVLWVISGSVAAIAMLELMYVMGWVDERVSIFGMKLGLGLDAIKLLAVLAFLHVAVNLGSAGARLGAQELISGSLAWMTWGGVVFVGILIPMVIAGWMLFAGKSKPLIVVSAVSALAGVLFLRAAVLLAGVWEPLLL